MNRAWMDCAPGTVEYRVGALHCYALHLLVRLMRPCPCRKCVNLVHHDWATIYDHLMVNGILRFHGEVVGVKPLDGMSGEL